MRKIILVLVIVISGSFFLLLSSNDCGILPKNANYKVVFGDNIYALTTHGLAKNGRIFDYDKWRKVEYRHIKDVKFNKATNIIYLNDYSSHNSLLYKIDINNLSGAPTAIPYTNSVYGYLVSPDGNLLVFQKNSTDDNTYLLNLKNNKLQKLSNIGNVSANGMHWINSYQFVYWGEDNSDSKKTLKFFLYDINSMIKKDMKIDGYPGAVTPDGKKILLTLYGRSKKTVLYDFVSGAIEVISNKSFYVHNMIWLPDGKGFLYNAKYWKDKLVTYEGRGLYYYSLEKKKHIRLASLAIKLDMIGGFFVPDDVKIKLPDSKWNRDFPTHTDSRLMQVCTKRFNFDWFK